MLITPQTEAAQRVLGHLDTLIPILSCLDDIEDIARASAVSRSWNIATQRLHLKVLSIDLTYLTGARKPAELLQWLQRRRQDQTFAEMDYLEVFSDVEPVEILGLGLPKEFKLGLKSVQSLCNTLSMTPNSLFWLDIKINTCVCPLVIKSSMFARFPQLKFLKVHVIGCDIDGGPSDAFKFQLDEPLHALETMIIWQALTCFPGGTEQAAAGFLPNVLSLCALLSTDDAQTMLDLGVAANLLFARFFLMDQQEEVHGVYEESPSYDDLVVLESNKLQYLQLQGPQNGDLSLEVHKVSIHLECYACHVTLCGNDDRWNDDMQMAFDISQPPFEIRSRV